MKFPVMKTLVGGVTGVIIIMGIKYLFGIGAATKLLAAQLLSYLSRIDSIQQMTASIASLRSRKFLTDLDVWQWIL